MDTKNAPESGEHPNEAQMRDSNPPKVESIEDLGKYIESLTNRPHDYGTCVYAMSLAAVASFNFVAGKLGVTGFQASCADLDILRRTRRMEGPFRILNYADALFPQSAEKFGRTISRETASWLKDQAAKKLAELGDGLAAPVVMEHWKKLADGELPFGMTVDTAGA